MPDGDFIGDFAKAAACESWSITVSSSRAPDSNSVSIWLKLKSTPSWFKTGSSLSRVGSSVDWETVSDNACILAVILANLDCTSMSVFRRRLFSSRSFRIVLSCGSFFELARSRSSRKWSACLRRNALWANRLRSLLQTSQLLLKF